MFYISQNYEEGTERKELMTGNKSMVNGKYKTNQGALEGLNETQELKTFYQRIMGIREETAVQELAEHSELLSLKAKTILLKENDKVERIHFLYKTGES